MYSFIFRHYSKARVNENILNIIRLNPHRNLKWFFSLSIVLISSIKGFAQHITGTVLNSNGIPIEAATILLQPGGTYAISNINGYFELSINQNDSLKYIEVSHISYTPQQIVLTEGFFDNPIEIIMQEVTNVLDEVIVVQYRILNKVIEKSQSSISIDKEFIAKNSTGTFSGALAKLPGIQTMNVGVGIAKPMIRGMGFNRILINNRGIKQEGQQWGADHGLEVDPFDVEDVEIIKGPASLLFGSDGLGGVINIKENPILGSNGNSLEISSAYQTNNGSISNSAEYKVRKDKLHYSARLTHQDYGDYTVPSNQFTYAGFNLPIFENRLKNTAGSELHLSTTIGYVSKKVNTSLRISSFNQKAGIFTGAIGLPRAYNLQHNGEFRDIDVPRQENHHHMVTSNTTVNLDTDRVEIDLGFQRNVREELSFPGAHGISPELIGTNLALGLYLNTYTLNLKYELNPNENHQILFGAQGQYMQNKKDGFEFLLPVFQSSQVGLFHYQSLDISTQWTVNAGLRYDFGQHHIERHLQPVYDPGTLMPTGDFTERTPQFKRHFNNLSGALGVNYKVNTANHLKLNLGNSFRFPTAIELSSNGVHHGNFRHELGSSSLGLERGYQADLTYLYQSDKLFLELATFYGYYTNYIYLAPTGNFSFLASGGTLWQYQQDDALFNGFEFTARYALSSQFKLDFAADFVQNLNLNSRLPLPLTPPASLLGGLEYTIPSTKKRFQDGRFFVSARYNFPQNRTDRNERETPESYLVDAGFGCSVKMKSRDIGLRISGNNLLNTAYFNHISRYRLLNLPEQGRNIMFSVNISLL